MSSSPDPASSRRRKRRGHEILSAVDLVPDQALLDGLFSSLTDHLVTAGFDGATDEDLTCQALTIRITGYRYAHVLLVLQVAYRHLAPLEEHTPNTVTSYLLSLLGALDPTFHALAERGLLEIDPDNVFGVPRTLLELGLMTPLVDTYLYDRHTILSGADRALPVPAVDDEHASLIDDVRPPLPVEGGVVHHPWAGPVWRLDEAADRATICFLLEAETLINAQRSGHENVCTVSLALGHALRRHLRTAPRRRWAWARPRTSALPLTVEQLRLVALHYVMITSEMASRETYLYDWQRRYQRTMLHEEPLDDLMARAERAKGIVETIVAQQENAQLESHQARVEAVISVLTLLTIYSVAATIITFIRTERIGLVGQRLASGETAFLAVLSVGVVLLASLLWRRR